MDTLSPVVDALRCRIVTRREGDTCRLRPEGELDLATAPLLEAALEQAEGQPVSAIDLDLGGVTFMDSSAVHVLMRASARARADSHRLRIDSPSRQASRLIEALGIAEHLPLA